jgi:predicted DNA-binding protein (MmcQ/YjbR family)
MASLKKARAAARAFALGLPGAHEDFPWGEAVAKVGAKVFVFFGRDGGGFSLSVKLPRSHGAASLMPFITPTGYGLGKAGWKTATFGAGDDVPLTMILEWVRESYCAFAPRKLVAKLDIAAPPRANPAPRVKSAPRRAPRRAAT